MIKITVKDLIIESFFKEFRYSIFISNNVETLIKTDASKNIKEKEKNKQNVNLFHIFKSSKHVILEKVMRSSIDKSINKVIKELFQTVQEKQKEFVLVNL